jgi:hypothetical protein
MRTRYKIDSYQPTYFVIDSFKQLFDATAPDFEPIYERVAALQELAAEERLPAGPCVLTSRLGGSDIALEAKRGDRRCVLRRALQQPPRFAEHALVKRHLHVATPGRWRLSQPASVAVDAGNTMLSQFP